MAERFDLNEPRVDPLQSAEAGIDSIARAGLSREEQAFCRRFSVLALVLAVPVVVFVEFIVVRFLYDLVATLRAHW